MPATSARDRRLWIAGVAAVSLAFLAGCNRKQSQDVVATVNGHAIMKADMERLYEEQLGQAPTQLPTPEQADQLRLRVVDGLIEQEIIDQRAAKMNLTATPEEVDAKIADIKAPYTEEQFSERLKASHRTLDDLKREVRQQLTIDKLINKEINSKVSVSDANVTSYYNEHKAEFAFVEPMYHLAEIRVTSVPSQQPGNLQGSKATTDAEARKKIAALKVRLDSGDDFANLAANYSENPETASNGGDMGFVPESQLRTNPPVYDAVSKLKAGQTTEVLPLLDGETKKPVGYEIYKLIAREPAGQRDIDDPRVQQLIRQQLHDGRTELLKAAYLEMLRNQAKVENFFAEQIFKDDAK
ncbi:MAG TPA: SurA N-terminal domain-containing protein [Acidobacteriaceae bacterium]|nr:SurA N-terminal domain-containing protein [Acidobacteriaceae bacterium]